ncbi:MAG TPA: type II secretion system protein M [Pseudomonadales bacterium]
MMAIKEWFNSLPKRDQLMLMIGAAVVLVYLLYVLGWRGIADYRDSQLQRVQAAQATVSWMKDTVVRIQALKGSGSGNNVHAGKSMAQLAEMAAGRASIRISRFAPSGNNDAQLWFERVEFDKLLDCISRLELEYGIVIDSIAINSANSPGLVNARLKITR